jgi:hypothetical protein
VTLTVGNATANLTESAISRTVAAGSTILMGIMDWNATNPPNKLPMTGNGGTATERRDAGDAVNYGQYICDWGPGPAGTYDFGPNTADGSTPTTADYSSLKVAQAICEVSSNAGTTSITQYAQVADWFASAAGSITGVSWVTGDAIVVISGCENNVGTAPPTPTNANLTFSSLASSTSGADLECGINLRSAIAGSDQTSQTISLTDPGTESGGACLWVIHENVVGGGLRAPFAPGHPTQSFQFARWFGVDPVTAADVTTTAGVSVGVVTGSTVTPQPSASSTVPVGVAARSTVTPEPSAVTRAQVGVVAVAGARPEPSAVTAVTVGVAVRAGAVPEPSATGTAFVGVAATAQVAASGDLTVTSGVYVGIATRSTVTPEPNAATKALVGVVARAGATVDISSTSQVSVGVAAVSVPASVNDVTVTATASVGVVSRSQPTAAPSAAAVALVGLQARSTGVTITVTAGSVNRVGIATASTPTAVWSTTSKTFVGVVVSTSLTPIAIIVVDRIDIWTEPAAPVYTEPSTAWIEPAADSYTEPATGWVEPPPVEGVSV